ncbi:S26 family signal peptidase [Mesorhizobium sp. INR15]|uniref:S26 family signal peptidase n=1 Tax=Mesorhizobium sp. INR15 TaxID=2654248 RepID=UPI0018966786|nr:S26 family signal peptidase [Mesorhizobium sp. INR15]QPC91548.1 S26 family signal peptidase [Mesorhizobium sp. INR15]
MSRIACSIMALGAVAAIIAPAVAKMPPLLMWNASASAPIGLYAISRSRRLTVGDLAVIEPPKPVASFVAQRGYLPAGMPMLKHIVALAGQKVCRIGRIVTVDGVALGAALARDHTGRPLPDWQGCRIIATGEIFVMNPKVGDSLDGRYFGPFPMTSIIGRALPLWTDESGDGRYVWLAPAN